MESHSPLSNDQLHALADDSNGPVALHLRQALLPVEGAGSPIFPPTYAGVGYNVDELADGTNIATIDSVGAQANRMEPAFKAIAPDLGENPRAVLIPQIDILYGNEKTVSLLDAGHRLGDALVRSTELKDEAQAAFKALLDRDDPTPLAKLAPTSLVFGVWDSRDTQAKLPRLVQATIRAEDVQELTRLAQYNPPLDYAALDVFTDADKEKAEGNKDNPLAQRGFVHVPVPKTHGGVIARGEIRRDVTVNLVALRRLGGTDARLLRRYVLGLALVAATCSQDGFLRVGCQLTLDPDKPGRWHSVMRSGEREPVALDETTALQYALDAASAFGVGADRRVNFNNKFAREDANRKAKKK